MKFGHHGANHPVKSHGRQHRDDHRPEPRLAVDEQTGCRIACVPPTSPLFDGSLQGIHRTDRPAFSFQGHPKARPGPHDVPVCSTTFIELIKQYRA